MARAAVGTGRRPAVVIGVLASCGVVVSLMHTLVVPLLPLFPVLLDTTPGNVAWLVTTTLLTGAVCAPVLGRLGDMYGKRRMLLIALATLSVGSALGAVASEFIVLLVARALQGTALGVIPLGISIMRDLLPEEKVASGTALMSATLGTGGAIGLPLAGLVAQQANWHWLFAGAAVLGVVQIVLVLAVVRESGHRSGGRFDVPGALGLAAALTCLLVAISKGSVWGWSSAATVGLLGTSAVLFTCWGGYELRVAAPLVNLRVSARPAVLLTNIASVMTGFAMFAAFMVSAPMLQAPPGTGYGFGLSLVLSGVLLLPVGLAMTTFSPLSARISRLRGPRVTLMLGACVMVIGNLARAFLHGQLVTVVVAVTVVAVGAALAYSALPTLIMQAVPTTETAAANSLNTLARTIGTSGCSAVVAAVTAGYTIEIGGRVHPSLTAYSMTFGLAACAALLAGLLAAAMPVRRTATSASATPVAVVAGCSR